MKISKVAATTARRLFGLCQTGGKLDDAKLRKVFTSLAETKPRDYRAILAALQRLTRLELERRKVTVESAVELDEATRQRVVAGLARQYGPDLVAEYQVNPRFSAASASASATTFSTAPSKAASTASPPHSDSSQLLITDNRQPSP
jgi:F-type H+-transporting ATPase subunit delta